MSAGVLESRKQFGYDPLENFPEEFPYSDGEPLESYWHVWQIGFLIQQTEMRWAERSDFFCGGNMFIHYSLERARNKDFRGPDFFLVRDVERHRPRKYWATWDENGRLPDLIIELLSPSTSAIDRGEKFRIYERTFKTLEYFLCDPESNTLEGYRLVRGRYQPIIPDPHGRLASEVLECSLGLHTWDEGGAVRNGIRYFDATGKLIPTHSELQAERLAAAEARIAQLEKRQ